MNCCGCKRPWLLQWPVLPLGITTPPRDASQQEMCAALPAHTADSQRSTHCVSPLWSSSSCPPLPALCTSDTLLCLQLRKWAEIVTWVLQLLVLGTGFFGLFSPHCLFYFIIFPASSCPDLVPKLPRDASVYRHFPLLLEQSCTLKLF